VGMLPTFVRHNARLFANGICIGRGPKELQLLLHLDDLPTAFVL